MTTKLDSEKRRRRERKDIHSVRGEKHKRGKGARSKNDNGVSLRKKMERNEKKKK